ncbi:MAG: hypothetical protein K0S58_1046 [Nitrospira sp.]|jgi:hypothetical protein|nr:hypothetical protein [Nitrospira sp.]
MQTCFSSDDPESLSVPCTLVVHDEDRLGSGTIWGFYPHCCHVESELSLSPGMIVCVSLHLRGNVRVKLEQGLITWAQASEFGLTFMPTSSAPTGERSPT